jgi:hypothetical protein
MAMAFFEAGFDTPFKAIPFYLLVGMGIAPGLQRSSAPEVRLAPARALPVAAR